MERATLGRLKPFDIDLTQSCALPWSAHIRYRLRPASRHLGVSGMSLALVGQQQEILNIN